MLPLRPLLGVFAVLSLLGPALAGPPDASVDLEATLRHVLPDKSELVWTQVPWKPTLWDAVIAAQAEKRPILLWAMNGHALACT
jgi:hypothetical protein